MNQRVPFSQRAIAHLKAFLTLCFAVLFCLSSFTAPAWANQPVNGFVVTNQPAVLNPINADVTNACSAERLSGPAPADVPCDFPNASPNPTVTMNFGAGNSRSLDGVTINGQTFVPDTANLPATNGLVSRVAFRRTNGLVDFTNNNPGNIPGPDTPAGRSQLFYEFDGTNPLGTTATIQPGVANSLEDGMRSRFINRGVDNIFNNQFDVPGAANGPPNNLRITQDTRNNIERVDYIIDAGLNIPVAERGDFGFLILDRGGNDAFGVAAITGLAGGLPTTYGDLLQVNLTGAFGAYGGVPAANIAS